MRGGHIEVGGLLQAGLLMELGFPSWRRDSKPCMWVGGGLSQSDYLFSLFHCGNIHMSQPVVWGGEKWNF